MRDRFGETPFLGGAAGFSTNRADNGAPSAKNRRININRIYYFTGANPLSVMERSAGRVQSFSTPANFTTGLFKRPRRKWCHSPLLVLLFSCVRRWQELLKAPRGALSFRLCSAGGRVDVRTRPALKFQFKSGLTAGDRDVARG